MLSGARAALIVMRSGRVADSFAASDTRAVKSKSPAVVGVPVIDPFAPRLMPGGSAPADTVQLYGGFPPVAATFAVYACPTLPEVSVLVEIVGGTAAAVIAICKSRVEDWLAASVTRAENVAVPAVVGVPVIEPFAPSVKPAGNVPADTAQLKGGVPPVADTDPVYACPTVPPANEVVVIAGAGAALIVI
jgi:hypothetical protein